MKKEPNFSVYNTPFLIKSKKPTANVIHPVKINNERASRLVSPYSQRNVEHYQSQKLLKIK